ncbi:polyketide synthase [Diaporthe sp. PMI_573]|nr:polyketide synthase [Diaporthaceae sp. PMI_573]
MASNYSGPEPVAIIGGSCRLPGGASSPSKLWNLLQNPRDLLSDIPKSRFNANAFHHNDPEHHGCSNVTKSYMLDEDTRLFDHTFFNISPKEAESTDPQHRVLLETVYEGVESAGYSIQRLKGSATAVFVGQMTADYYDVLARDFDTIPQYMSTGTSRCLTSNKISYFFDWKGPSVTIDTACSSSLVAVHQAVQELRHGESTLAIAAGVNLILGPENYIHESKLHMLSPTGRSRMWDAEADGYARGEGSAAVVLKLLHQAIADGDDIECIIRETGVNQDGRTAGITVPSVCSQTELIRSTYRRCGLDCSKPEDRCQYFEAHGTGTLAGDPVEAEAVRNAFFDKLRNFEDTPVDSLPELLHVGSIKTVVGHLEGAAGLAGLLKASLAIQHGLIPGNMHFNQLNPAITPFYDHLRVPTKPTPWPELPQSVPRRASVNSFGFGGTNCHAILERWEPDGATLPTGAFPCGPFTISANSKPSLRSAIAALADKLKNTEESKINLADLAFTLQMRRSVLPFKASVSATTSPELIGKLASYLSASQDAESNSPWCTASARVTESLPPRILGVFTGQGAQWPRMGASLYEKSAGFRRSMQELERSLASLPDPPEWSMVSELLAAAPTSRVHEAAISQPLCTALQISLVDLLASCGIAFHGVVGHSSGEIAAAYAAGYINAHDAIRIAYYRGVHADFSSHRDAPGRMMAVGMGFEEARNFCLRDQFVGRIVVAASNSRSSTTLSGDADAIDEAKSLLDSIEVFARILKVEKAYHSHHMDACSQPYLDSLRHCNIAVQSNSQDNCKWFSSVYGPDGRSIHNPTALKNEYWVENLSQPVLFSQALDRAVTESYCYDMVLEVGPHAALESPAKETLKTLTGVDIPYVGCLSRGKNDMTAFSDALGFLWRHFQSPTPVVDFQGFRRACIGQEAADKASVAKGLPTYVWDHDKILWNESRVSRLYRERKSPPHELLGTTISDGDMKEVRWRNIFKLREMEWLRGHQFQGQVLFPAAGYVSMAIEAAIRLVDSEQHAFVQFVELKDLIIHDAITLEEDSRGTDVRFVIRVTERSSTWIAADYTCYSADVDGSSQGMDKVNFTGRAVVTLGVSPKPLALPAREAPRLPLANLELSRFYSSLEDIGLHYTGDFVMESASRMLNTATITARDLGSPLLVHPATLDATFQGVFAAYCFPGDGRLRSGYLPTSIECVRVDVSALKRSQSIEDSELIHTADCYVRSTSGSEISGDVSIFQGPDHHPELQIEGLTCTSLERNLAKNDRKTFAQTIWMPDISSELPLGAPWCPEDKELSEKIERVVYFYLRNLRDEISTDEIPDMDDHFQCLMDWAMNHVLPRIESGRHPRVNAAWKDDTPEMIASWKAQFSGKIDMDLITALGQALPAICRGTLPTLQVLMENDMLNRFYKEGLGFPQANRHLASLVSRFSHRYPHIKVLEIGAGTGGATAHVLKALSPQLESYTYTDISPGFFENARSLFHEYLPKMSFKTLDVERDPMDQGYEEESYDLIIASNVLHATKVLANTLQNCRRLLRPGGQLLLMEITSAEETVRLGFITAGLPGWWLGRADGRVHAPTISEAQWDRVLAENGFSGVDVARRDFDECHYNTVMATQAIDDRVAILREPLSMRNGSKTDNSLVPHINKLVIVGGREPPQRSVVRGLQKLLQPFLRDVSVVESLEDLVTESFTSGIVTLCLADLDEPVWKTMTEIRFNGMKKLFIGSKLGSDAKFLFLSQSNASVVCAPSDQRIEWDQRLSDVDALHEILAHLIAENLFHGVNGSLWVHEADDRLARCLIDCSKRQGLKLFLSTASPQEDPVRCFIHPRTPGRDLAKLLPAEFSRYANAEHGNLEEFSDAFCSFSEKRGAEVHRLISNVRGRQSVALQFPQHAMLDILSKECLRMSSKDTKHFSSDTPAEVTEATSVKGLPLAEKGPAHVLAWRGRGTVPALVQSFESTKLFSDDKTYLLVGLTGEVGLSLCRWMVGCGARHLAITSRNPDIPVASLQDLQRRGARVRVFSLDISDREALTKVHSEICGTMPPIAGVANAAMVLKDRAFENTTLDDFQTVFAPKVQGSKNLDDLFFSTDLEFFVLFSSIASVVGSKGQANYGAANLFMHSLARQRRKRDVAGSVMDIAMLLGVGYVARSLDQYESQMKQYSYMAISEPEFHDIFAAAILSGRPGSNHSPEIITGVGPDADAPWTTDPRFSHFVCHEQRTAEVAEATRSSGNVLSQLAQSESSEALSILEAAFSSKVELMLQLELGSMDCQAPLVRVGIDSLVAVELRSWFLRELDIDMPVLKFLNGASVLDICKDALARLSESSRTQRTADNSIEIDASETGPLFSDPPSPYESEPEAQTPGLDFVLDSPNESADMTPFSGTTTPDNEIDNKQVNGGSTKFSSYERIGPMSVGQTRLFFLQEYSQKKSAYTVIMLGKAQHTVNISKLQKALDSVAQKHESLRSAFFMDQPSGEFVQAVTGTSGISLEHKFVTGPEDLASVVEAHKTFEFDLANGQTIKFLILSEPSGGQYILICYHHIVLDGFSAIMFLKDLDEAYSGRTLVPPAQQAIDLCAKQRLTRVPSNLQDELQFWAKIHSPPAETLPLMQFSKVRNRQILRKFDVVWHDVIFDAEVTRRVKAMGTRLGVTPFNIYLSTLAAFLSRSLDVKDLNIGVMDSNRLDTQDLETFGYFMNFLPLRFSVQPKEAYRSLARRTRDMMYDALANSRAPLATIIDHLKVPRSGTHHPLFQVALNYRQDNSTRSSFGDVPIEWLDGTNLGYPYDMKFDVNDTPDGTRFCLVTQKYLYGASDAKRLVKWYEAALTAFLHDPDISIGSYSLSNQQGDAKALGLGEGPRLPLDVHHHTLAHQIEEMAISYPDSVAIADNQGYHLTYSEMMARSEKIATVLQRATQDRLGGSVAVLLTTGPDLACSLLAIMRLGLVYVPLDPHSSTEHLEVMVSDCQPSAILCHGATKTQAGHLATAGIPITNIDDLENETAVDENPTEILATPGQVGFVMYTNGTSGPPKGVLLTHSGLMNQIRGITSQFGIGREVVLQSASPESDLSLEQMFIALANGGTLVMLPQSARGDAAEMANIMLAERITYTTFAPSDYLHLLKSGSSVLEKCASWRSAFAGRGKVSARLRRGIRDLALPGLELVSAYGPVEASISCCRARVNYHDPVEDISDIAGESFCGFAMPNYSIVIVDQDLRPVPIGHPGEICIAGPGLAGGYLNRPDDHAQRFTDNPHASSDDMIRGWAKLFRSGDKGRLLEDGSVHFIRRLKSNRDVTIQDNLVNLDEIADVIITEESPNILDAAVSWREESGVLVAFVTLVDESAGDMTAFLRQLRVKVPLPTYMIPDVILPVHTLPKTLSGRKDFHAIDRLRVPGESIGRASTGAFSPFEMRLKGIWESLMCAGRVSELKPESDFFCVGGSSLLLIPLQAAVRADMGCNLSLPDLFQFRTIRSMAACIQGRT